MSWQTTTFIGFLAAIVTGAVAMSMSGAMLPTSDESDALSLRNIESRRTHYMRNYALGK